MSEPTMMDALRLTREGRLGDATGLIQAMLRGGDPATAIATAPGAGQAQPVAVPSGAFVDGVHDTGQGRMRYKLYRPCSLASPAALVVMLHGCTQTADDFALGTRMNALADEFGVLVAYPEQSRAANAQRCWNWFRPGDQARGGGEPAAIAGLTCALIAAEDVDAERVFVAGLSAGAAAAAIMGEAYPDLFSAVGVHSGLACGAAHDLPSALAAMQRGATAPVGTARFVPTFVVHGDQDHVVSAANADLLWSRLIAASPTPLVVIESSIAATAARRGYRRATATDGAGVVRAERWAVQGAGHAWSGGAPGGSYTDPTGPDASRAMLRFFLGQACA